MASVAADLGIGRSSGVSVAKPRHSKRLGQATRRACRIHKLAAVAPRKIGARLILTGALPQASYAWKVLGVAPSVLQQRRRALTSTLARGTAGRCLTTLLALEVRKKDPAFTTVFQLLESWFQIVAALPEKKIGSHACLLESHG